MYLDLAVYEPDAGSVTGEEAFGSAAVGALC
jgi:hypothetical protein